MLLKGQHPLLQTDKFLFRFDRFVDFRHGVLASKIMPAPMQVTAYNKQFEAKTQETSLNFAQACRGTMAESLAQLAAANRQQKNRSYPEAAEAGRTVWPRAPDTGRAGQGARGSGQDMDKTSFTDGHSESPPGDRL